MASKSGYGEESYGFLGLGGSYKGYFKDGKYHGKGDRAWSWHHYSGDWKNGKRHGKGKMNYVWEKYEGDWENDKRHGNGKSTYSSDWWYEGEWSNGVKHGWGTEVRDGHIYEGYWRNGFKTKGTMKYEDKSVYEGEWHGDFRRGTGKMTYSKDDPRVEYDGLWDEDRPHGLGTTSFKSGSIHSAYYAGYYITETHDDKHTFSNGDKYEGGWDYVHLNGQGEYVRDKHGCMHGKGECINADGTKYTGYWKHGQEIDKKTYEAWQEETRRQEERDRREQERAEKVKVVWDAVE
eukprot:CAMPEP_0183736622 /NCGR_PEP_ID=MMETSP0737-20130205/49773_1 /TAXON_ID=385413 /ORGANISM="Thalassiosira miniscula, Strain CCMP1093" /LENGTH=290 /DNA_ID=CAMNT_0025970675 /DNA_START=287 /DNA_END=1156 /DNA_ORIENTATION=+